MTSLYLEALPQSLGASEVAKSRRIALYLPKLEDSLKDSCELKVKRFKQQLFQHVFSLSRARAVVLWQLLTHFQALQSFRDWC